MQPSLPFIDTPAPALRCAFGTDWLAHDGCTGCAAHSEALAASYGASVAAGRFNARGYTRGEWKAAGQDAASFLLTL